MKVALINEYKDKFKQRLIQTHDYDEAYKYECLQNFTANWDLDALALEDIYDKSFSSNISGRLWGGSQSSAKEMMLRFINHDREFMRSAFRDLFAEYKDISLRMNRFIEHCDEMLTQLKKTDKKINHHFHDHRIVSLYLTFQYPMNYNIFDYSDFKRMMLRLDAKNIPLDFEVERFFKLSNGIYKIISKDEELVELHKSKLNKEDYYQQDTLLLVHDYFVVCSKI